ncbi:MAG: folate-binding protein [Alphaproteobacteria bacterium]|nr:MAG: folate-binding protein [Alphaproteobacteria bacterium]
MTALTLAPLENRALLRLSGKDVRHFLQNLVTNDVSTVSESRAVYAALLTAQGKFLHDFIILQAGDDFLIDCAKDRKDDLVRRLTMYKLRADVTIAEGEETLYALFGEGAAETAGLSPAPGTAGKFEEARVLVDPRLASLGVRIIASEGFDPKTAFANAKAGSAKGFEAHRLSLGVPEGGADIVPEKNFLLEANFEELNGVSFAKGCYVGQELTARTKHRAKIKKRLFRITADTPLAPGDKIMAGEKEIGEVRSFENGQGLALIRLEELANAAPESISPEGITLSPPDYLDASSLSVAG